ncbi:MAG: prepilin-type N-terminal cleavage/methylation domain-containing protein [Deltaproteobacteria bacterium]|nr:prepilin-type N-terminal cleavage/methylation domain-containing protein [Deltaproteobacteria bacterium]
MYLENNEKGFTLLEVMIGLAILAGVIISLVASVNYHMEVSSKVTQTVLGTILGKEKAEELKLMENTGALEGDFSPEFSQYSWKLSEENTEIPGLKRRELNIIWDTNGISFITFRQEK